MLILDATVSPDPSGTQRLLGCILESFRYALNADCSDCIPDPEAGPEPVPDDCSYSWVEPVMEATLMSS